MKKLIAALLAAMLTLVCCAPALGENTKHERVYIVTGPDGEIRSLTDIKGLNAFLDIRVALVLIGISMLLTLIAGIIPSRSASKKDPVVALRTE